MTEKTTKMSDSKQDPVNLEQLAQEEARLKAFQGTDHVSPVATGKIFTAVSLYGVAVDFGLAILVPLLAAIYGGRWLAERYGRPSIVPLAIVLALAISAVAIYKQILSLKRKVGL